MAAIKALSIFFIVLVAASMVIDVTEAATRVGPCDQVCSRIPAERDECCRAHGRSGHSHCSGGRMYCR